ncbi:alpha-amylase family glycosyl hydrolase [Haliangium sp.]|uniref:alpha-amylase family glycosyl hydrolase n=1 Tax=Haliangium sp. TaxID=2663208 RepID=UPI003D113B66
MLRDRIDVSMHRLASSLVASGLIAVATLGCGCAADELGELAAGAAGAAGTDKAGDEWYFRGTPNGWGLEALASQGGSVYETCQSFLGGDESGGPRFKIDRFGDWSENYPAQDYSVAVGTYLVRFDAASKQIEVSPVAGCGGGGDTWYFRGTPNGWGATAMDSDDGVVFCTIQDFGGGDGNGGPRFKIDHYGDWSENYPAQDYAVSADTRYQICFDAGSKQITATVVGGGDPGDPGDGAAYTTLGAEYTPEGTTFAIWSPDHGDVRVRLDGDEHQLERAPDRDGYTDVYALYVPGDHHLKPYQFVVDGVSVRDPYGKMVEPNTNTNIVMDMSRTELAEGWSPRPAQVEREDAVIYELHVRDFTIDDSSGVSPELRGKFLGLVEPGTRYQGVATGIDHLVELGVTHVQILPFYDFASCANVADQSCYNWGYDPRNYNVPEERYSLTPFDYENRARELKRMVDELHKAGIRVIMDVVYNHTYAKEMFEPISGRYYTPTDLSGTGNSIDANVPMVSRMIRDSLEYWVREYNLDGFRFDLIGIFDYDDVGDWGRHLNAVFPDRTLLLYGEPWNGYASDPRELDRVRLGTIARIGDARVGVFNPKFREAIKGQNDSGGCNPGDCYAFGGFPDTWRIEVGSRGGIRYANDPNAAIDTWDSMFAADPEQSINYVSAHDNLTLRDKILFWADGNGVARSSAYLRRIQMFANGIVLTSQGVPFLHGGVELLRDKQGEHNSYNAGDEVNKYRWQWKLDNADVFAYYRDVIALRKAHPGLRFNTWDEIDRHVTTTRPRYGVVVHDIDAAANGDSWSEIIVIYNNADNYSFALPPGEWKVAMERSDPGAGNGRAVSGSVIAEGTAVTVLYRE